MINISRVQEYKKRSKVSVSETGSELMIGAAGAEDGGEYNCSLTLGGATQAVVHTVVIKGQLTHPEYPPCNEGCSFFVLLEFLYFYRKSY